MYPHLIVVVKSGKENFSTMLTFMVILSRDSGIVPHEHHRAARAAASADLYRTFHAEARHGVARGLPAGGLSRRCGLGTDGGDRGAAAVDGDCDRVGRDAG